MGAFNANNAENDALVLNLSCIHVTQVVHTDFVSKIKFLIRNK